MLGSILQTATLVQSITGGDSRPSIDVMGIFYVVVLGHVISQSLFTGRNLPIAQIFSGLRFRKVVSLHYNSTSVAAIVDSGQKGRTVITARIITPDFCLCYGGVACLHY